MTGKVAKDHLQRTAYLYVRQSTLRQVIENTESTRRQYALSERALELGWREDQVVVIDCDLGDPAPPTGRGSAISWPRSASAMPASCSASRYRALPAITSIGIGY